MSLEKFLSLDSLLTKLENSFSELENDKETISEKLLLLEILRKIATRIKQLDAFIVSDITKTAKNEQYLDMSSGGIAEISWSKPRRKWDHERLASVIAEKIIEDSIDKETGVIEKPPHEMVLDIMEYAGISYWKVTPLKAKGIDYTKYCEEGQSNPSIKIHSNRKA